ncbi:MULTISPECIES: PucR family transcriptional regulator [unclassified Micromonospora]|uniref:PucR family transcriptional regulator n=1 Tax=unclassified Micromonospora TaxID=2617518 RepID=UPI0003EEDA37|nr:MULTISPECIES: PucR family transcriptional regulator [unclassified Micromonospora]EWM67899.1 regulatory protein [Micromonospora sp. M42]MCK1808159.1 PucR family transcriptional regulator ligand-binding domain-containing protein [Micromonospora sp. R42106]MCK1832817.1 PucR family transcriptional regulator ligand-binding domain-containing protein [Micromonospora sp. R42003]MCK1844209.1 PucR family transcriptional regulator ligand-binding domain-containing protein [Micromonospora sp. R42004]MCM
MPMTVRDVLELPALQQAGPRVMAGRDRLDAPVRWVHVAEIPEIADLLRGGELVLTTGIGLPPDDDGLRRWIDGLAAVGAAGVVVELGRRFGGTLPAALVEQARSRNLPLVALQREMRFVAVTEVVHSVIVEEQTAELLAKDEIHRIFTELSVEGAEPRQVLREVTRLSRRPVVLENLSHQVLAYETGPLSAEELLDRWETRSRAVEVPSGTGYEPRSGWLVTGVEARGNRWGRLVLLCDQEPPARTSVLLERAASTIALNQLVARDDSSVERQARSSLLWSIVNHSAPTRDVALRARGLGVALEQRRLLGVVVRRRRPGPGPGAEMNARRRELLDAVETAVRDCGLSALAGDVDGLGGAEVTVLVALTDAESDEAALLGLSTALTRAGVRAGSDVVVAAGSVVRSLDLARRSLIEAAQVADATAHTAEPRPFYRLLDVRLRGLLYLLRDDVRLQTFVERELGPLLSYDERHGTNHVALLEAYLVEGRNKRRAAEEMSLSRSALYQRLQLIERVLGVDLDSSERRLSLHVALTARDVMRGGGISGAAG